MQYIAMMPVFFHSVANMISIKIGEAHKRVLEPILLGFFAGFRVGKVLFLAEKGPTVIVYFHRFVDLKCGLLRLLGNLYS